MRSDSNQLDLYRDDPAKIARAWRAAAETALHDPQFTETERQRRHDYYATEAARLEGLIA